MGIPPEMGFRRPVKARCLLPLPLSSQKGSTLSFSYIESNFHPSSPLTALTPALLSNLTKKKGRTEDGGGQEGPSHVMSFPSHTKKMKKPPLNIFLGGGEGRGDSGQLYQHISNFASPFFYSRAPQFPTKKYKKGNSLGRGKKEGAFGGLVRDTICACLSSHRSRPEKHRRARNSTYCPFSHKIETKKKTKKDDIKKWGDECMYVAEE